MYLQSLEENVIPWRKGWSNSLNKNGITGKEYNGINRMILSYIAYKENYDDNRWYTYVQIKNNGYKLKEGKGKGVPIEFWSVYDIKYKRNISFEEYNKIISINPEMKNNFKTYCNITYVFNGSLIEGIPKKNISKILSIKPNDYIRKIIRKLNVNYEEKGDKAFYDLVGDKVVIPSLDKFLDEYSCYATQLHELSHSTGHESRLNRLEIRNIEDYAKEELIAEISSSFLMQKLNVTPKMEDYNNHKAYIQSWIKLLNDKPNELFKAINESTKVYNYIEDIIKDKEIMR